MHALMRWLSFRPQWCRPAVLFPFRRHFANEPLHPTLSTPKAKLPVPARQPIVLNETELQIKYVSGWGKGGQAVNRTKNAIQITHLPTGIVVKCHDTRSTKSNLSGAKKMLIAKLDDLYNGDQSKRAIRLAKAKRRNAKQKQRTRAKYGPAADAKKSSESTTREEANKT